MTLDFWSEITIASTYDAMPQSIINLFGLEPDPTPPATLLQLPATAGFTITYAHYAAMWLLFQSGDRIQKGTTSDDFYAPDGRFEMFANELTDLYINGYAEKVRSNWRLSARGRAVFLDSDDLIALDPIEYAMAKNELAKHKLTVWETYYKRAGVIDWTIVWQPLTADDKRRVIVAERVDMARIKRRRIEAAERGETKTVKRGGRVVTCFSPTQNRRIS